MADRSLTLTFLGKDVSASAAAEALAAKLRVLEAATNDSTKSADKFDGKLKKVATSADDAYKKMSPLVSTALLLGPALVPIGAAAVAAGAGFAGMGAAALLAFGGIKREITSATPLGKQYADSFKPIVDEFHQLQLIAAGHVFEGINKGIEASKAIFPELNKDIAVLADHLGNIAGHVGVGLVNLFHDLNPLFLSLADAVDKGAAKFALWAANSDGPKRFVQYAQAQLPTVISTLKNLGDAVLHIAQAAAPLGGVTLQAVSALAAAIARIPVPVLTAMLAALEVGKIASMTNAISGLATAFGLLRGGASGAGIAAGGFAGAIGVVGIAVAGIAVAGTALVNWLDKGKLNFDKIASSANSFASALGTTGGAIDATVIKAVALQIQTTGIAKKTADANISLTQLTAGVIGTDEQFNNLIKQYQASGHASKDVEIALISLHAQFGNTKDAAAAVSGTVDDLTGSLHKYNATPVPVKPIKVDASQVPPAILKAQDDIDSLHGKTVPVTIQWSGPGGAPGPAAAGFFGKAAGGPIRGPGGPTGDRIPILASDNEFMMRSAAVNKYGLGFMENVNALKFAAGGPIVLQLPSGVAAHGAAIENALHPVWNIPSSAPLPGGGAAVSGNVAALQAYAFSLFPAYGWGAGAQSSLVSLWNGESGWNPAAYNASSGATGIPQSLPASKMASAGADYLTNGATQIRWGLSYIASVYGSPTNAYSAWLSRSPHWYGSGLGPTLFNRPTLLGVGERGPETVSIARGDQRGGGGITVVINVNGSVVSERDLVQTVANGLSKLARNGFRMPQLVGM